MFVELQIQDDLCVLRLRGRFVTGADAGYLRTKADEAKATGCRKVLVDFREVPYLDSTGIGFLVALYTSIHNLGGQFALINLNPRVREVLELTRLATVLPIYKDQASALETLGTVPKQLAAEN